MPKKLPKVKGMHSINSSSSSSSVEAPRSQSSTLGEVHWQIVRWQQLNKDFKVKELKEREDYEVHVKAK